MVRDGLRFAAPALSRNPKTFPFYNPEKVQTRTNPFSCSLPLRGEGWGGGLRFAQFDQPAKLQTRRANPKSYALPPAPALASAPALSRNPKSYKPLFLLPPTPWGGLGRGAAVRSALPTRKVTNSARQPEKLRAPPSARAESQPEKLHAPFPAPSHSVGRVGEGGRGSLSSTNPQSYALPPSARAGPSARAESQPEKLT